jgi:flagellar assembly factor FliW
MKSNPLKTPTEPGTFQINSRRFGQISVRPDQIIVLTPGLLGFSKFHRYVLIEHQTESPFLWLQSLENPDLAFVVIDPGLIVPGYRPGNLEEVRRELEAEKLQDIKTLVILTIPPDRPQEMTANLMGPVIINLKTRRGKQLIIEEPRYSHKHRILPK